MVSKNAFERHPGNNERKVLTISEIERQQCPIDFWNATFHMCRPHPSGRAPAIRKQKDRDYRVNSAKAQKTHRSRCP